MAKIFRAVKKLMATVRLEHTGTISLKVVYQYYYCA